MDFISIGDITTDAFIRLKQAEVHCDVNKEACQICMAFASKIPYEFVEVIRGVGNSANAAVAAARLGLSTGLVTNIGDDENGRECMDTVQQNGVSTELFTVHRNKETNYHYVLWFSDERTILVKHQEYQYRLPKFAAPRWLYVSSLGGNTLKYHKEIFEYIEKNPDMKVAVQPGTFQISLGITEDFISFYERADVSICNVEEAKKILGTDVEIKGLLKAFAALGPKIVLITDGPKGAYMASENKYWFMPIYPDPKPPYERTGCGDAFAATFVSALELGKTPEEALVWAPINPMSVVQYIGAQKGLLTRSQLEKLLDNAPADYRPREL